MKTGDRVAVITTDDEWSGMVGVMVGLRADGFVEVQLDQCPAWERPVAFWPHDLELEAIVKEREKC